MMKHDLPVKLEIDLSPIADAFDSPEAFKTWLLIFALLAAFGLCTAAIDHIRNKRSPVERMRGRHFGGV